MNITPILSSYIDEINDNLKLLEEHINKINSNNSNSNTNNNKIEEIIKFIESDISSLKLEYNNNNNNKSDINKDQNIKPILQKYDQLKSQYNKIKLLNNSNSSSSSSSNNGNSYTYRDQNGKLITVNSKDSNDTRDRVARLNKIHENNLKMIQDCKRDIATMTNTAIETNIELRRQTEQMRNMEKKFDNIDSQLDQSNKTVDKMLKRWF